MYKFYNANTLGNFVDDCVIRAISVAENNTWDYTYNKLSDLAQAQGRMIDDRVFVRDYLDRHYKRIPKMNVSVGELAGMYPDKVLLITMQGHITCSIPNGSTGVIIDSFDCRNRRVEDAWIV